MGRCFRVTLMLPSFSIFLRRKIIYVTLSDSNRDCGRLNWVYKCLNYSYWVASQLWQQLGKRHFRKEKVGNLDMTLTSYSPIGLYEYANFDNLYSSKGLPFFAFFHFGKFSFFFDKRYHKKEKFISYYLLSAAELIPWEWYLFPCCLFL